MKAVILVGGEGTRMRPLTLDTPKPLLPIANIPFIERQIKWLQNYGVDQVVLSLCYLPDQFEDYFSKNPIDGVEISYVVEDEPLGTGGAIKYSAGQVQDWVIVCNGDVLTEIDLSQLIELHKNRDSLATIVLTQVEDPSAFGVVPTDEDNKVIAFVEKPAKELAPSNWINAGIYLLSKEFLDLIPAGLQISIERETFPKAILEGAMYALESDAYWLDIGTIEKYVQAHTDFIKKNIREKNFISGVNTIFSTGSENSYSTFGSSVQIGENSKVENSVVFDNAVIGANCVIIDSVIGANAIIGDNVEMTGFSVVGNNEKIEDATHLDGERIPSNE